MPDIELKTHEYARRDPRTGKMVRDLPPRWARNWFLFSAGILVWDFFYGLSGTSPQTNFAFAVFWAFIAGVMAQAWLKDIY